MNRYFIIYKPYKMVSQFISPYEQSKLGDLNYNFPQGTNAVGRLDDESEGLLILTTDKALTQRLLHPEKKHTRSYIVQVEKIISQEALQQLNTGVQILIKGQNRLYTTQACQVTIINKPINLALRPKSLREDLPQTWLQFILTEGKNRQIRKMCKTLGYEVVTLCRTKIDAVELGTLKAGEKVEFTVKE